MALRNIWVHLVFTIRISNSSGWAISFFPSILWKWHVFIPSFYCITTTLRLLTPSSPKNVWRFVGPAIIFPMLTHFNWVRAQKTLRKFLLNLYFDTTKTVESELWKTIFYCASAKKLGFWHIMSWTELWSWPPLFSLLWRSHLGGMKNDSNFHMLVSLQPSFAP